MRRNELPDACFSILPSTGQLIIIKKGESGYYPSEWDTGNREKNRDIASSHNESRGISDMQESAMLAGSMFGWDTPGANPQWYLDNAKYANANILQGHVKDPVMSIYYPINGLILRYEIMGKQQPYLPMDKLPNELMGMNAQFIMQPDLVCGRPAILLSYKENIMPTKDELETKLYEKMSQENAAFLAEMKTKSPDEIISRAYEIACRDNLLMLFEDETSLSERQLAVLTEFEHPLSQLYTDWLSRDTDEMDAFRDSIASCANDILRKRTEEKYRDPAQPVYPNTRSEAMARGEIFEWMASRDRTLTCAGAFEKDATNAYNDGTLSVFLKDWTTTYGKDRCMFVLACTMAQRTGDERFYPPARQAAGRFAALQKQMGGHTDIYAVDNHSCVINAAMEQLAKPERSKEKPVAQRKQSEPER